MKYFIVMIGLLLLSTTSAAQNVSGAYYDTSRDGEGIFVFHNEEQGRILFSLYTFNPTQEHCETVPEVTYQITSEDPVIVVQDEYDVCVTTGNDTSWYIGTADWDNGAFGEVYTAEAYNYPMAFFDEIAEVYVVGLFRLDAIKGGGMRLLIVPHGTGEAPDELFGAYSFNKNLFQPKPLGEGDED